MSFLNATSLHTRISKKAFWLFAVLITVPISVSAILAINNLSDELLTQQKRRLHQFEKNFLMSAFSELQNEEKRLRELASLQEDLGKEALIKVLNKSFTQYVVAGAGLNLINGINESSLGHILRYNKDNPATSVFIVKDGGTNQVWMASKPAGEIFVATSVDPFALLGNPDFLPEKMELCVVEDTGREIFCPHDFPQAEITAAINTSKGFHSSAAGRELDDSRYVKSYWTLFMQSGFSSHNWVILARLPRSYVFSPIVQFRRHFIPLIVAIIFSSVLILLVQLRRNLAPLERLLEGTKKIGKKDFSTRIQMEGEDEFAELAKSFNLMSSHLDRQFLAIEVSAQIDETILRTFDFDRVVNVLLVRIFEIFDCTVASVVLNDEEEKANRIYYCSVGQEPRFIDSLGEFGFDKPNQLIWFNAHKGVPPAVDGIFHGIGQRFSGAAVPIIMEGKSVGLLALDVQKNELDLDVTEEVLNDLAQRLAVAKSADEWEARLKYQAHHDLLTGLPNRLSFQQYLEDAVSADRNMTVLFLDLDHFKNVNDTKGHSTGDQLLKVAAQRLRAVSRSRGEVFRLGGDEFTIVLNDGHSAEVETFTEGLLELMRSPFVIDGGEFMITASIGVASFPQSGGSVESLVKNADLAMYYAKQDGRNKARYFDSKMMYATYTRTVLEADLRKAVKENQFFLLYQPQVNIKRQEAVALEALIRWRHPIHGVVMPDIFLPVAEDIGLIGEIDHWVLRTVFKQYDTWVWQNTGVQKIAVNVSPSTLQTQSYLDHLGRLMSRYELKNFLELEITENVCLEQTEDIQVIMERLKALGVYIALDDFGTGYSSMGYLHKLPIDVLKIDISFIREIERGRGARSIVQAIIKIASTMDLTIVAEGVETGEQLAFLAQEGCDVVQGYYYSKPLDADTVADYIDSFNPLQQVSA